jgi:hypothetical protein
MTPQVWGLDGLAIDSGALIAEFDCGARAISDLASGFRQSDRRRLRKHHARHTPHAGKWREN